MTATPFGPDELERLQAAFDLFRDSQGRPHEPVLSARWEELEELRAFVLDERRRKEAALRARDGALALLQPYRAAGRSLAAIRRAMPEDKAAEAERLFDLAQRLAAEV